jgi:peptidyl-tRNA hydrolase
MNNSSSKMYILVRNSISLGHAITAVAHASLSGFLTWEYADAGDEYVPVRSWVSDSFKKVVCGTNDEDFEAAKTYGVVGVDYRVITESRLGHDQVAMVWRPRTEWPDFFRSLPLYKGPAIESSQPQGGEIIEDGFGNAWSKICPKCGKESMAVVRPGDARCGLCE